MDMYNFIYKNIENYAGGNIPFDAIKIPLENFPEMNAFMGDVIREFKDINQFEGMVKINYDKGLGVLQKAKKGGFTGNIINPDTGLITGHVNFQDIQAATQYASTLSAVSSVMNVMSIVTSQYYLNEINYKMSMFSSKLKNVERFLETDRKSHISSREKYIEDVQKNLIVIQYSKEEKLAVLTQLQQLQVESYSDYLMFKEMISENIEDLQEVKKTDEVMDKIGKMNAYLPQLWCSLYLYANTKYLNMVLSETVDEKRIYDIYSELSNMITEYENTVTAYNSKAFGLINNHEAFKVNNKAFDVVKFAGYMFPGRVSRNLVLNGVREIMNIKKIEEREAAIRALFESFYGAFKDISPVQNICDEIRFYNILYNQPVEFYFDENEIFIKHGNLNGTRQTGTNY